MKNPEKIEIEGLNTIHKLCKFGADHNMEGCTFTEIVERMLDELAKARAVIDHSDKILMPRSLDQKHIDYVVHQLAISSGASLISEVYECLIEAQEPANDI